MKSTQEFGDGIMSAVDMFASADDIVGAFGERRMVIALNGKVRTAVFPLQSSTHTG